MRTRALLKKLAVGDEFTVTGKVIAQQEGMTFVRMGGRRWYVPGGLWVVLPTKAEREEEAR